METKTISIRLIPELDRKIRIEAAKRDLNRSEFIRKILLEEIKRYDNRDQNIYK